MDMIQLLEQEYDQYINDSISTQNYISDILTSDIDLEHSDLLEKLKTENNLKIFNILSSINYSSMYYPSQFPRIEKICNFIYPIVEGKTVISKEQLKYEIFTSPPLEKKVTSLISHNSNLDKDYVINHNYYKNKNNRIDYKKIFEIIRNDDFVSFQDIVSQFDIELDGEINIPSFFEHKKFFKFHFRYISERNNNDESDDNEDDENYENNKEHIGKNRLNSFVYKGKFIEIAAFFGSINIFKFLWMNKVNIDDSIGKYVIAGGNYEIIHLVEDCISYSQDDLYAAIQFHQNDIYDYIINNNDFKFNENEIMTAVSSNNLEFLVNNIDQIKECQKNDNVIHYLTKSIHNKNVMIFIFLFIQNYQNLKELERFSLSSLLKEAISEKSFEIVKFLINVQSKIGDSARFIDDLRGDDIIKGTGEIMEYLLPYISHNIVFDSNMMCKASENSVVEVVKYIDAKCNLFKDTEFNKNETPFHCACLAGNLDVIDYLSKVHKEWIEAKDNEGISPIHNAVMSSKLKAVKFLIFNVKVDFNVVDNENRTPLHYAIDEEFADIVEFLCSLKNININIENANGATPLELAINKKNIDIVNILKKKGGKQNIFSNI